MSLANKISEFRISGSSFTHDIPSQNMTIQWVPEFQGNTPYVQSLDGTRHNRFLGHRARIQIDYDSNISPATWRDLFNRIQVDLVGSGDDSVEFYPDATKTTASDKIDVIPDDYSYLSQYSNQMGNFAPNLVLVGVNRLDFIPSEFDGPS